MLFRSTFREPRHAASLLKAVLPPALAGVVDWASLALLPGSFVDPELRDHHTDLLFSLAVARQRMLVYVLLEHKSSVDRWTAFQLLQYVFRVHAAFRRANARATHLPPIVPIVVSARSLPNAAIDPGPAAVTSRRRAVPRGRCPEPRRG